MLSAQHGDAQRDKGALRLLSAVPGRLCVAAVAAQAGMQGAEPAEGGAIGLLASTRLSRAPPPRVGDARGLPTASPAGSCGDARSAPCLPGAAALTSTLSCGGLRAAAIGGGDTARSTSDGLGCCRCGGAGSPGRARCGQLPAGCGDVARLQLACRSRAAAPACLLPPPLAATAVMESLGLNGASAGDTRAAAG